MTAGLTDPPVVAPTRASSAARNDAAAPVTTAPSVGATATELPSCAPRTAERSGGRPGSADL